MPASNNNQSYTDAVMTAVRPLFRALRFALLLSLCVTPVRETRAQDELPELVRRIKPSAVAIETFDARGEKLSRGSGFFIDVDRVVTNRHVIDGADRAEALSVSGAVYQVKGVIA